MTLDTEKTIYVGIDRTNAYLKILLPKGCKLDLMELRLDDPHPESTDAAEFRLLVEEMEDFQFEL